MVSTAPTARLNQFFRLSRLLAGQLDFGSAIRAVATEVAQIVPFDHFDVCMVVGGGHLHTAYETGIDTHWGSMPQAPIVNSPIRALLMGEVDHMITADACTDPQFQGDGAVFRPIFDHSLRSRIHLPMVVHGQIIGALSFSLHEVGRYGAEDIRNGRYIAELLSPYFFALRAAEQARQSAIVEAEARAREEGLRLGALKLTEALEQERQRIGMDLHDQTLADMTRLARRLERISRNEQINPADLHHASESLHLSMQALRQIIEAAKPSVLHLFGFVHAVENHLDRAIRDAGSATRHVLTDRSGGAIDALPSAVGMALFRITQEAINNAVNHAQANLVSVALGLSRDQITLTIKDDGIGFARGRTGTGTGTGIDNMRTRARLISARFVQTTGTSGQGTRIGLTLPVSALPAVPKKVAQG